MGPFCRPPLGEQVRHRIAGTGPRPPPQVHGRGGRLEGPGVQAAQDGGASEIVEPDVQGKGVDRLELGLGERGRHQGVEGVRRLAEVIAQEGIGVPGLDYRPRPGEPGVPIADHPAPVGLRLGLKAQGLEGSDEIQGGGRDPRIELHLTHHDTTHSPAAHPCKNVTGPVPMI